MAETGAGIQKIIHQIWLGTNAQPIEWIQTVKDFAKQYGYVYKVWTDSSIDSLDWSSFPGLRQEYINFKNEMAGRADIIRLLALYQYGGIYIDADSVIMKPAKFAAFLNKNKAGVFFGWENLKKKDTQTRKLAIKHNNTRRLVANGLIGTIRQHPFIKILLDGLVINAKKKSKDPAWKRVGPLYVTRMYTKHKDNFPDIHMYPMNYFYPLHWKGITDPMLHTKISIPKASMLFQYGYSTNKFHTYFNARRRGKTRKM